MIKFLKKTTVLASFAFKRVILIIATLGIVISSASARQPSSFQGTCKDIAIRDNILIANCRKAGTFAGYQLTSIQLRGIINSDGELKDDGSNNPASFHETCQNANPNEEKNTFGFDIETMFANCQKQDGTLVYTGIRIKGIENIDGNLMYTS
ncbi:MAG: CVNH domain-containing protein [Rivularia sp. ALOHA_DT_140]|nr:CVNH domain-containing protein [Rivularia sp. ALOHA_DT_140]